MFIQFFHEQPSVILTANPMIKKLGVRVERVKVKFTIEFKEMGVLISGMDGRSLKLSASEALMILDILKNEERELRKIAKEASPIPITIGNYDNI